MHSKRKLYFQLYNSPIFKSPWTNLNILYFFTSWLAFLRSLGKALTVEKEIGKDEISKVCISTQYCTRCLIITICVNFVDILFSDLAGAYAATGGALNAIDGAFGCE